jgi:hypothetical protein
MGNENLTPAPEPIKMMTGFLAKSIPCAQGRYRDTPQMAEAAVRTKANAGVGRLISWRESGDDRLRSWRSRPDMHDWLTDCQLRRLAHGR